MVIDIDLLIGVIEVVIVDFEVSFDQFEFEYSIYRVEEVFELRINSFFKGCVGSLLM